MMSNANKRESMEMKEATTSKHASQSLCTRTVVSYVVGEAHDQAMLKKAKGRRLAGELF